MTVNIAPGIAGPAGPSGTGGGGGSPTVLTGNLSAAYTVTLPSAGIVGTLTTNCTITVAGRAAGLQTLLLLTQDTTGGRTVTISDGTTSQVVPFPTAANAFAGILIDCPNSTDIYATPLGGNGPAGPAGATGTTGATGPTGPTGPAASVTWTAVTAFGTNIGARSGFSPPAVGVGSNGLAYLAGVLNVTGAVASGATVMTLPTSTAFPTYFKAVPTFGNNGTAGTGDNPNTIDISTAGVVTWQGIALATGGYILLDNVSYALTH